MILPSFCKAMTASAIAQTYMKGEGKGSATQDSLREETWRSSENGSLDPFVVGDDSDRPVETTRRFRFSSFSKKKKTAFVPEVPHKEDIEPAQAVAKTVSSTKAHNELSPDVPVISQEEVKGLFDLWNNALATLDPHTVAKRYTKDAVLLPTVSDTPRRCYPSIKAYFVDFLKKKPHGVILQSNITQGAGWCMDSGIYEFTMGVTGDKVKARYSYVYQYEEGEWKIAHHHSSVMPEALLESPSSTGEEESYSGDIPSLSQEEVKGLFDLWNNALATLDPHTVAKRYTKDAVLLPTVSDTPRRCYPSIKAYFVDFLKKKPHGVILQSNTTQGAGWCMDSGIYEFTMGATGDKVKARYSYVYQYEEGEWKIAHHHSSVMPEALLG